MRNEVSGVNCGQNCLGVLIANGVIGELNA